MKLYASTLLLLLSSNAKAQITRTECVNQGGKVVGDIGNGAIFQPDYQCENSGDGPTDNVIPDGTDGEAFAADGEVCCGGTGEGLGSANNGGFGGEGTFGEATPGLGGPSCTVDGDCPPINCFVAPCDEVVCNNGKCEVDTQGSPAAECVQDSDCPVLQCFVAPCDVNVCNAGACEMQKVEGSFPEDGQGLTGGPLRAGATRQECVEDYEGTVVGDIGNGDIFKPDYVCESNGLPPVAEVLPAEGEPIASEGEVCCGPAEEGVGRDIATRQECTEDLGGVVVGDIGDGAIHSPDYVCDSNGLPPIADVIPAEGEPIAFEGEVCCGAAPAQGVASDADTPAPSTTATPETVGATADPTFDASESTTTSGAGDKMVAGSVVAAVVAVGALTAETFVDFFIEDAWA